MKPATNFFIGSLIFYLAFAAGIFITDYSYKNNPILAAPKRSVNTRYWMIGYKGGNVTGYYTFWNTQFPSSKSIGEDIKKLCKDDQSWTITFIYEFKNETDFNNFRR